MKKILLTFIIIINLIPAISKAAVDQYTLLEPLPCVGGVTNNNCTPGQTQAKIDLNTYIQYIYRFAVAIAVFLAIIMIIWGGFQYITSEIPFIKSDGRSKIENALTGLFFVLASYLILQTIDPRLVNIDSSLPQIIRDPKDIQATQDFQSKLANDLKDVKNTENQAKILDYNNQIANLQKEKQGILNMKEAGASGLTEQEIAALLSDIDRRTNEATVAKNTLEAQNKGAVDYAQVIQNINDPGANKDNLKQYLDTSVPNPTGSTPRPINTPNEIQNAYNKSINALLKTNSSPDQIQTLEKQRDFYIAQAQEDTSFIQKSREDKYDESGTDTVYDKQMLQSKLTQYTNEKNDPQKLKNSGLTAEEYNKIYDARINTIKSTLADPKISFK